MVLKKCALNGCWLNYAFKWVICKIQCFHKESLICTLYHKAMLVRAANKHIKSSIKLTFSYLHDAFLGLAVPNNSNWAHPDKSSSCTSWTSLLQWHALQTFLQKCKSKPGHVGPRRIKNQLKKNCVYFFIS